MKSLLRKMLRHAHQQSQQEGIPARKQVRIILDRNDVFDIKQLIVASSCRFSTLTGQAHYSKYRQQFHPSAAESFQIAAYWADSSSMEGKHAAYGAILGAFTGDASGGVLEFMASGVTAQQVDAALRMPGGGCWELGPGQVTDDSEMALCLLQALLQSPGSAELPLDAIAGWYIQWLHSPPFDIGSTTHDALSMSPEAERAADVGARMVANAAQHNQSSLSNGCLMRVTPLAVWAHQQPVGVIAQHAMAQTALTHPNPTAQIGTAAYCIAIAHLINHPRDAQGAITAVSTWLQQQRQQRGLARAAGTVQGWLLEAQTAGPGPEVCHNIGYMRWGFVHVFRALHLELSYVDAIRHVLLLGGDTDTNAAIVGGMVGALWGASGIPAYMSKPVLAFDGSSGGRKRPAFLHTKQLPQLFDQLWAAAQS